MEEEEEEGAAAAAAGGGAGSGAAGSVAEAAGAEVGPSRGFSLAETELGLSASIDPWLRGQASIALHPDNSVSVEEAFVQTTSLGNGLSLLRDIAPTLLDLMALPQPEEMTGRSLIGNTA